MSDEYGPIVCSEVAPAPSETPRGPASEAPEEKSRGEIVKDQFNLGLGLMAHGTEDATDFIRERETQERFLAGDDFIRRADARVARADTLSFAAGSKRRGAG